MTLVELQNILGKQIADLTDEREPHESKKRIAETATVISSLAKQKKRPDRVPSRFMRKIVCRLRLNEVSWQ